MADRRIISGKAGYYTLLLREEYLCVCEGNHCAAMILSQHEYWHKHRLENRQQAQSHNEGARRMGLPATQDTGLWVYRSHEQTKAELLNLFGEKAIGQAYKYLIKKGFLLTRLNPKQPWDRKPQYLFNVAAVQSAVNALPSREEEPDEIAESSPQNCGEDSAEVRTPSRNGADSTPPDGGDSKESLKNLPERINQRLAPVAPGDSLALLEELGEEKKADVKPAVSQLESQWRNMTPDEKERYRAAALIECKKAGKEQPGPRLLDSAMQNAWRRTIAQKSAEKGVRE